VIRTTACLFAALMSGLLGLGLADVSEAQQPVDLHSLNAQVSAFLSDARGSWGDLNVPYEDGKILHDLVLKNKAINILEIGTSTGHSTIWLAWAAAKTGGKVTTIEIDKRRYRTALENFRKAGVTAYIEARLADAHSLAPNLKGPFDFVFCDADKEWYLQYFLDLESKMSAKGCFTAHNVLWGRDPDIRRFLDYVKGNPRFRTHIERGSGEGISVSCRISE
jgi:caffeoyl-CoA O-methyltransferase